MPLLTTGFAEPQNRNIMARHQINAAAANDLIIVEEKMAFDEAFDDIVYKGLMPVQAGNRLWIQGFKSEEFGTLSGQAKIISGYSDDLPSAMYDRAEGVVTPVRLLGCSYSYNVMEIATAQRMKEPLQQHRALAARHSMELKLQNVAFFGAKEAGLEGLFTHSRVNRVAALPNSASTSTSWYDKTANEIIAEITARIKQFNNDSDGRKTITDIYLDIPHFDHIDAMIVPNTDGKTVLEFIEQKSRNITKGTIKAFKDIQGVGVGDTDIMIIMSKNKRNFEFKVPFVPTFYNAQIDGLAWKRPMIATTGGVVIKDQKSILIVEGI